MELRLNSVHGTDEDDEETASQWTSELWEKLAELDEVDSLQPDPDAPPPPDGAKGAAAALLAHLTGVDALKAAVEVLRAWTARTGRTVEVSLDGDTLKISRASREQQDEIVEAWLVRHSKA